MRLTMKISRLAPNLFAGAQIAPRDLNMLAEEGFTDIVCHRPDSEHADGPVSAKVSTAAERLGLRFHYQPITPGAPYATQAEALKRLTTRPGAKVFAYCRSGGRVAQAWTLAQTPQREHARQA